MRICRMLGGGDVSLGGGDDRQTLARVCRGLSVGRRLCWAPSTQPGLVPISPSEGTQWGHDGDRRSCHGFWPPITRTRGQEGEGVPPAGVPRSGGGCRGTTPAPCLLWEDPAARLKGDAGGCCRVRSSTHGLSAVGGDEGSLCGVPSLSSSSRWQPARGPVGSVGWVPGVPRPRTRGSGAGQGWRGAEQLLGLLVPGVLVALVVPSVPHPLTL